jgi:putative ABC transport system substrate-binding protein
MQRREFITLLGSAAAAWPLTVRAQQTERVRRIGVLFTLGKDNAEGQARLAAFRQGLETLGWTDGRNLQMDDRWPGDDSGRLRTYAAELVSLKPDAIMVGGSRGLIALQKETRVIPVVFVAAAGTIEHGIVKNVARPTGNLTGFTTFDDFSLAGKLLGQLKEMVPRLARIALIMHRDHPSLAGYRRELATDAPSLGVQPIAVPASSAAEIESAIDTFAREPNGGLLLPQDQFNVLHRELIIALAARHRLPAIYGYRSHVAAGGLMSYGIDIYALYRRAAGYVDRILKGEKPADLPVQAPTKYELVINLKTAKALGLNVPPTLLARADEVIE